MSHLLSSDQGNPGGARHPCGSGPGSLAGEPDRYDVGLLAQEITSRLFSAGQDLYFALMMVRDGPARSWLEHAVTELDDAITDLRHLMLACWEQAGDPAGQGRAGQGPIRLVATTPARHGRMRDGGWGPTHTSGI